MKAIAVEELTVSYEKISALWNINVEISKGTIVGILGPNGGGKSTFLQALMGLVPLHSGRLSFFGQPQKEGLRKVAYIPQKNAIDWTFPITLLDVVLMGRYQRLSGLKWYRKKDKIAAFKMLEKLGIEHLAERQINALSGGQKQRLFIARALLQEASIYLLDEPFAGVDKGTEKSIVTLLKELRDEGKTILVVHHELSSANTYFDRLLLLNTCLIGYGKTETLFTSEMIERTFGCQERLLDEVWKMSKEKAAGIRS